MTRSEAIAIITAVPALDEAQETTLAEWARTLVHAPVALSPTDADRAGID